MGTVKINLQHADAHVWMSFIVIYEQMTRLCAISFNESDPK